MHLAVVGSRIFGDLPYIAAFVHLSLLANPDTVIVTTSNQGADATVARVTRQTGNQLILFSVEGSRAGYRVERWDGRREIIAEERNYLDAVHRRDNALIAASDMMIVFQQRVHGVPTPETAHLIQQAAFRLRPIVIDWDGHTPLPRLQDIRNRIW